MSNEIERNEEQLRRVRPASDIVELEDGFHIYMDMPGVGKEDLVIDLAKNEVSVSAAVHEQYAKEARERSVTHAEFGPGRYVRSFTLADTVDRARIKASVHNGVLDLHLPKSEKAVPKRIEITVE